MSRWTPVTASHGLAHTADRAWAVYLLPDFHWPMASEEARTDALAAWGSGLAALKDASCHLLVTSTPYNEDAWMARLATTVHRPEEGWSAYELALADRVGRARPEVRQAWLAVRVDDRTGRASGVFDRLVEMRRKAEQTAGVADGIDGRLGARWGDEARRILRTLTVSMPGTRAATDVETGRLVARPWWLSIDRTATRAEGLIERGYHQTHVVQADGDRWVATLPVGTLRPRDWPDGAWLLPLEGVDPQPDVSARFLIVPPAIARRHLDRARRRAEDQIANRNDHALVPSREAEIAVEAREHAERIQQDRTPVVYASVAYVVEADGRAELSDRVRHVQDAARLVGLEVERPAASQVALLVEQGVGQPWRVRDWEQQMPVETFAAALPHATSALGDDIGPLLGWTSDLVTRPVMFDPFQLPKNNRPTTIAITGTLGGGKSTAAKKLAKEARMRGAWVVIVDPSAESGGLAEQLIRLDSSDAGRLDPWAVEHDPAAAAVLAVDMASALLKPALAERVDEALTRCAAVEARAPRPCFTGMIRRLHDEGPDAAIAGAYLDALADLPLARLLYGAGAADELPIEDNALTVVQIAGLDLPDENERREDWKLSQRVSVAAFQAAVTFAARLLARADADVPKMLVVHEAHRLTFSSFGVGLVVRLSLMGRKRNTVLVLDTQNVAHLRGEQILNNVEAVLAFRSQDPTELGHVAGLLRIEGTPEQRARIASLGNGECMFRDPAGRVGAVHVDLITPWMRQLTSTTPGVTALPPPVASLRV